MKIKSTSELVQTALGQIKAISSQEAFNLSNDLATNTSKKVSKLDENSAQFILQGALDYLTKENT